MATIVYLEGETTQEFVASGDFEKAQVFALGTVGAPTSNLAEYSISSGGFLIGSIVRGTREVYLEGEITTEFEPSGRLSVVLSSMKGESTQGSHATGVATIVIQEEVEGEAVQYSEGYGIVNEQQRLTGEAVQLTYGELAKIRQTERLEGSEPEWFSWGYGNLTEGEKPHKEVHVSGEAVQLTYGYEVSECGEITAASLSSTCRVNGYAEQLSEATCNENIRVSKLRQIEYLRGTEPEWFHCAYGDLSRCERVFKEVTMAGEATQLTYAFYQGECGKITAPALTEMIRLTGQATQYSEGSADRNIKVSKIRRISYLYGEAVQQTYGEPADTILTKNITGSEPEWISFGIGLKPRREFHLYQERAANIQTRDVFGDFDIGVGTDQSLASGYSATWGSLGNNSHVQYQHALWGSTTQFTEGYGKLVVEDLLYGEAEQASEGSGFLSTVKNIAGETVQNSEGSGVLSEGQYVSGEAQQFYEPEIPDLREEQQLSGVADQYFTPSNTATLTITYISGQVTQYSEASAEPIRAIYYGFSGEGQQETEANNKYLAFISYMGGQASQEFNTEAPDMTVQLSVSGSANQYYTADPAVLATNKFIHGEATQESEGFCSGVSERVHCAGTAEQLSEGALATANLTSYLSGETIQEYEPYGKAILGRVLRSEVSQLTEGSGSKLNEVLQLTGSDVIQLTESNGYCTTNKHVSGTAEQQEIGEGLLTTYNQLNSVEVAQYTDGVGSVLSEKVEGGVGSQETEASGFINISTIYEPIDSPTIEIYN